MMADFEDHIIILQDEGDQVTLVVNRSAVEEEH